jgi:hypothetical protein
VHHERIATITAMIALSAIDFALADVNIARTPTR